MLALSEDLNPTHSESIIMCSKIYKKHFRIALILGSFRSSKRKRPMKKREQGTVRLKSSTMQIFCSIFTIADSEKELAARSDKDWAFKGWMSWYFDAIHKHALPTSCNLERSTGTWAIYLSNRDTVRNIVDLLRRYLCWIWYNHSRSLRRKVLRIFGWKSNHENAWFFTSLSAWISFGEWFFQSPWRNSHFHRKTKTHIRLHFHESLDLGRDPQLLSAQFSSLWSFSPFQEFFFVSFVFR